MALKGAKSSSAPDMEAEEGEATDEGDGSDYKKIAKDAAKAGDWDACIDALCSYIDNHH